MKQGAISRAYASAISEFLIEQRKISGRTLEEVGSVLGITTTSMYRYETGQREIPLNLFRRLCVFYGCDFVAVFTEISDKATEYVLREVKK